MRVLVSDGAGRGALCSPTPPRVTGCERVATLSRSPGDGLTRILVSDEAGKGCAVLALFVVDISASDGTRDCSGDGLGFRRRGCGALCSPTPPRVTGYERVVTLSRSPGDDLTGILVFEETGMVLVVGLGYGGVERVALLQDGVVSRVLCGESFSGDVGKERGRVRGLFGGWWHVSGDMAYASSREGVRE